MATAVGPLLKRWRTHRHLSQLELSARAGVSQRHLSFVETGRSRPSRELVVHLADSLDVPLRERNVLLKAAGYAPLYRESSLDDEAMAPVRKAIQLILDRHTPFPAVVLDRHWNLVMANPAAAFLTGRLAGPEALAAANGNLFRLLLHPDGLRGAIANWDEVVVATLWRLHREAAAYPDDPHLAGLLDELGRYPDLPEGAIRPDLAQSPDFVIPIHFRNDDLDVRVFSTLATVGAPLDITVQELVIELFFPADDASEAALRSMAG
jgi:transcriptional regulator with XRE-family HTH domain